MPPQMANPNFGQLSPLTAQLQTGGSQGRSWSYAYGGFLPRLPQDFTEGAFGPFSPILPVPVDAPASPDTPRAEPRWWEYPVGWNLPVGTPGSEGGVKLADFSTLRTLADLYSVARACIELRKNEIRGLNWDIMPTKDAAKAMRGSPTKAADFGKRRAEAIKFFNHADPDYDTWTEWLGVVLEEVLVYDTCALLMQPSWGNSKGVFGTDLKHLRLVTAPTIRPLVDMHGAKPRPPAPAFQQYLYGVPRTDLQTMITQEDIERYKGLEGPAFRGDQLLYHRMTPRRWTPYGFAPIEQALIPVMAGLQKQGYQLDFFREGTVPAVYVSPGGANSNMTPNQIRELQDALNAIAGDVAWKHKIIVLPADSKVMPQKPTELADQFDEIVMTQVCMAFGVQPMELGIQPKVSTTTSPGASNQMAKASQSTQERKATKPLLTFLTSIFNMVLQDVCEQDDMQFVFEGLEEDEDEERQTTMLVTQIGAGLRSIDEARGELGLQPWGLPETVDPGWATATGFVPLGQLTTTGDVAPGQQPTAQNPAGQQPGATGAKPAGGGQPPANGAAPAKPTGGPGKPSGGGSAPAKPAPKKPSGSGGASANPGHAAAQAADASGTSKSITPVISKAQETHQARREQRVNDAASQVRQTLRDTVAAYQAGQITHAQAMTDATDTLADGYQQAMAAASEDAVADYADTALMDFAGLAVTLATSQQTFLGGLFYAAMGMAQAELDWLNSRLTAYENTVNMAYNQAFGQTIQGSHPEYAIIWHLGNAEHCSLCVARDGKKFTFDNLPGYPGNGGFGGPVCLGGPNCHCSLEYTQPDMDSLWGENVQRPWASNYYAEQLQDITAMRDQTIANRADFLAGIPEQAAVEAMTRDQIAAELAALENEAIRAGGGYHGVSVEWGDITAAQIAEVVDQMGKGELIPGLVKAMDAELAALARHYRKGRSIISWKPKHISSMMLMSIEEDVTKGLSIEQAIEIAKGPTLRRVLTNGQVVEVPAPDYDELPTAAARVPAGGGGRVFPAHDVNGIEVGAGRRVVMDEPVQPEVPGGVPGPSAGGEPPRWAPAEGTSSGETMSKPRRRVRSAPPDEDDADYPQSRAPQPSQGGGPRGGAPSMASIGTSTSPVTGIPGARKDSLGSKVKELMLSNFPASALGWVDRADWSGPTEVALSDIDFDDEEKWAAHHQRDKVDHFKDKIQAGEALHPAIMVKEPGDPKLKVVDGHHRTLAYKALGKPVPAYIARVTAGDKDWEETHSSQLHQGDDPANKGKVSKASVNYRESASAERACGTCSMIRINPPDFETYSCTLVEGSILPEMVCDEWAPEATKGISPTVLKMAEQLHKDGGNPTALRNWYASGAGGAINWGGPGDLTACHAIASRHMSSDQAWGFCQERHIQATGKPNPRDD